jgi:DNA (cytosine-5)-methyltransferase 1
MSGLFATFARAFRVVRPRNIILENVPALLGRGMGKVCGALASCGYDSEWDCIPASAFGAHHQRDRLWIVARSSNTNGLRQQGEWSPRIKGPWSREQFERLVQHQVELSVPAGSHGRVSDGVSDRVGKLRGLGNAVIPETPEWIGKQLNE